MLQTNEFSSPEGREEKIDNSSIIIGSIIILVIVVIIFIISVSIIVNKSVDRVIEKMSNMNISVINGQEEPKFIKVTRDISQEDEGVLVTFD